METVKTCSELLLYRLDINIFQFLSFQIICPLFPSLTFPHGKYIIPKGNSRTKLCIRLLFTEIRTGVASLASELLND